MSETWSKTIYLTKVLAERFGVLLVATTNSKNIYWSICWIVFWINALANKSYSLLCMSLIACKSQLPLAISIRCCYSRCITGVLSGCPQEEAAEAELLVWKMGTGNFTELHLLKRTDFLQMKIWTSISSPRLQWTDGWMQTCEWLFTLAPQRSIQVFFCLKYKTKTGSSTLCFESVFVFWKCAISQLLRFQFNKITWKEVHFLQTTPYKFPSESKNNNYVSTKKVPVDLGKGSSEYVLIYCKSLWNCASCRRQPGSLKRDCVSFIFLSTHTHSCCQKPCSTRQARMHATGRRAICKYYHLINQADD